MMPLSAFTTWPPRPTVLSFSAILPATTSATVLASLALALATFFFSAGAAAFGGGDDRPVWHGRCGGGCGRVHDRSEDDPVEGAFARESLTRGVGRWTSILGIASPQAEAQRPRSLRPRHEAQ